MTEQFPMSLLPRCAQFGLLSKEEAEEYVKERKEAGNAVRCLSSPIRDKPTMPSPNVFLCVRLFGEQGAPKTLLRVVFSEI